MALNFKVREREVVERSPFQGESLRGASPLTDATFKHPRKYPRFCLGKPTQPVTDQ